MKQFLIGLVVGFVLGGTGAYAVVKERVEKVATKKNAEKLADATADFGKDVSKIFK